MRLLTKTTLYFLSAMVSLLIVSALYLFHQFSRQINNRSDKELIGDEMVWIQYLEAESENGTTFILRTKDLSIFPTNAPLNQYPSITDTREEVPQTNNRVLYRQLSQVVAVAGIPYQIIIKKSQEQKTALISSFTRIMLFVFGGLFLATIIFIQAINRRLWAPFNNSLQKIRNAELQKMEAVHFEKTNTLEFNELNESLNYMTGKMYNDYVNMKEFTEDAAHEMQTPIAVVQSKLELLLQDANLNAEQAEPVLQASDALSRLARLNQGLLLLAKIENHQYKTDNEISLAAINKKYLELFSELIKDKELVVETHFEEDCKLPLHPLLADSLITNLLGNAIKYNYKGGSIHIITTAKSYEISNSSLLEPISPDRLFKRFKTSKENGESSNGLGLAIIKKIADTNNLAIAYQVKNGMHHFAITKNST